MRNAFAEVCAVVFAFFVGVVTLVMVMSAGAAAQTGGNSTAATGEYIDQNTVLENVEFDDDNEEATITLRSSSFQTITLTNAAGYWTEGPPAQREVTLAPNETAQVTIPVTAQGGRYGVVIDTETTMYPVMLKEPDEGLDWINLLTSFEALVTGAGSAFSWFVISGVYVLYIEGGEPEVA